MSVLAMFFLIGYGYNNLNEKKDQYVLKVEEKNNIWYYEIYLKNKLIIKQESIPAVKGKQPFSSKDDATRIGKLVLKKLFNKQNPTVSHEDLIQHNIEFK